MGISKITTEEFIKRAEKVHGKIYKYHKTTYIGSHNEIEVVCPVHGSFFTTASQHVHQKYGCHSCAMEKRRMSFDQFVEKANKTHNSRFLYEEKDQFFSFDKGEVYVICPDHGKFLHKCRIHLQTRFACPICAKEKRGLRTKSTEDFIKDAKKVHGNKYDYSLVEYKNSKKKVEIICPVHGSFFQIANAHLMGSGCSACRASRGEMLISMVLDSNNIKYKREYVGHGLMGFSGTHPIRCDFQFIYHGIEFWVEYDGEQHYNPTVKFSNRLKHAEYFIKILVHSMKKSKYAENNSIVLVNIPFFLNNKEAEEFLLLSIGKSSVNSKLHVLYKNNPARYTELENIINENEDKLLQHANDFFDRGIIQKNMDIILALEEY